MKINEQEFKLANGTIRKIDDEFGHSYWHDDYGYSVGATTILQETLPTPYGLKQWYQNEDKYTIEKIFKEAQEQGTLTHQIIELLNQAKEVDLTQERQTTKMQVAAYIDWVRNWQPEEMQTEQVIFYLDDNMQFAGTIDIVARIDGVLTLIDLKTSNIVGLSAHLQVSGYAKGYEQSYGEKIEKTLILQLGTTHKTLNNRTPIMNRPSNGVGWKIHEHNKSDKEWDLTYQMWQMMHDGVYPQPPKVVEYPDKVKLFDVTQLHPRVQSQLKEAQTLEQQNGHIG